MGNIYIKRNNIKIRIGQENEGQRILKAIIFHPMETGRRRDKKTGGFVPADYIEDIIFSIEGEKIFEMGMGEDISKNPFLSFVFTRPLFEGQKMTITWFDNKRNKVSYDGVLKFTDKGSFSFNGSKKEAKLFTLSPEARPVCKSKTPTPTQQ